MAELWSLLHFIMPTLFDSHDEFREWFAKDIEQSASMSVSNNTASESVIGEVDPDDEDANRTASQDFEDDCEDEELDVPNIKTGGNINSIPLNQTQVQRLHMILKPFMLRRVCFHIIVNCILIVCSLVFRVSGEK
jgi:SNF2 family DNA or RNA helicase